jgi:hypothetical protein
MIFTSIFNPYPTFTAVTVTGLTAGFVKTAAGAGGLLSTEAFGANTCIPYSSGAGFSYSPNLTSDGTTVSCGGLILKSTQNYLLSPITYGSTYVCDLKNNISGNLTVFQLTAKDMDGTDNVIFRLIPIGVPDTSDLRLVFRYPNTQTKFEIFSGRSGTTYSYLPLYIYSGTNTSQLVLNTDGTISLGGNLGVTGSVKASSLTSGRVVITSTSGLLSDSSAFLYDPATVTITLGQASVVNGAINVIGTGTFSTGFGCNGKTAQTAYSSGGAAGGTPTLATGYGFVSAAEMNAFTALVANIRLALVANGIMS